VLKIDLKKIKYEYGYKSAFWNNRNNQVIIDPQKVMAQVKVRHKLVLTKECQIHRCCFTLSVDCNINIWTIFMWLTRIKITLLLLNDFNTWSKFQNKSLVQYNKLSRQVAMNWYWRSLMVKNIIKFN